MARGSAFVPAEPFRALLEERLKQLSHDWSETSPMELLSFEIGLGERNLYRVLNVAQKITFQLADQIVTKLRGPMLWHEDETLAEIYHGVDLEKEDLVNPLDHDVAREAADLRIIELWDLCGSRGRAGEMVGLGLASFSRILDPALKRAGRERTKPRKSHRQAHEEWKARNIDHVREYDRKRSNEKYANDPEYRERKLQQQRAYRARLRQRAEQYDVLEAEQS